MYRFLLSNQLHIVHIDYINTCIICVTDVVNVRTRNKRVLNLTLSLKYQKEIP